MGGPCTRGIAGGRWGVGRMACIGFQKRRRGVTGVAAHWLCAAKKKKKKPAYGFAAWLGICDSYSSACHICQGHRALCQSAYNQSLTADNKRATLNLCDWRLFVLRPAVKKACVLWLEVGPRRPLQRLTVNMVKQHSVLCNGERVFVLGRGWVIIVLVESRTRFQQLPVFRLKRSCRWCKRELLPPAFFFFLKDVSPVG